MIEIKKELYYRKENEKVMENFEDERVIMIKREIMRKEKRRRLKNNVSGRKSDDRWRVNENGKNSER